MGVQTTRQSPARYIYRKRGIYYFQRRVPKDLLKHYRSECIAVSLRTRQRSIALDRAKALAIKLDHYWYRLRFERSDVPLAHLLVNGNINTAAELRLDDVAQLYRERRGVNRGKRFHAGTSRSFGYLKKVAGNRLIESYTRQDALKLRDYLRARGLAPQSIRRTMSAIRTAFNLAINEYGLDIKNVFASVDYGQEQLVQKRNPISTEALQLVQAECRKKDDEARRLIALISDTGMRLAEALGLRISDIKLDADVPHVDLKPHPWRLLKTRGSARKIPLVGQSLWAAERVVENANSNKAFPTYTDEQVCRADRASAALNKWLKSRIEEEGVVIHSFRHSLRDRLRAVECPADIIDQIGGWKTEGVGQAYGKGYSLEVLHKWMESI
jgi:integrase